MSNGLRMISGLMHKMVMRTRTEELIVSLRKKSFFIRKLIPVKLRNKFTSLGKLLPPSTSYSKVDCYPVSRDNTNFIINRSDYVQWRLFYGVRDNALREAKKYLKDDCIILDIGASFGAFSLRLATHANQQSISKVQIHAFEPNLDLIECYEKNLVLNPAASKFIQLHSFGLGNENGERSFNNNSINTGAGRIAKVGAPGDRKVKIQKLDEFIQHLNPNKIAFIKLIAAGFEPEVIKGGWNTIVKYRPPIFFEVTRVWWEDNNSTISAILDDLASLGYQFMIEHHNELLPYEAVKYSSRTQFNLLAKI